MAPSDVRLTTRWEPDDLAMSFYSCLHEFGHGLYESAADPRTIGRRCASDAGSASTSPRAGCGRTWSAAPGRSATWVLPVLRRHFGGLFDAMDVPQLYRSVNQVRLSLIRIEADETTYNLHIALRFELELALVEGRLSAKDLPDAWNEATHRLLGLEVPSIQQGVLQDIHWGSGMIGYFPTYTIGNLMAAQLWRALNDDIADVDEQIAAGEFGPIREWLRTHIHVHGRKYDSRDAAPPGHRGGAAGRAAARVPRGEAARCRASDRARARSPLLANICSESPSATAVD